MKHTKINISEKELDRDISNLSIAESKRHIPLLEVDDMNWLSDEQKEDVKKSLLEEDE